VLCVCTHSRLCVCVRVYIIVVVRVISLWVTVKQAAPLCSACMYALLCVCVCVCCVCWPHAFARLFVYENAIVCMRVCTCVATLQEAQALDATAASGVCVLEETWRVVVCDFVSV
jgi:hypothetical protein